MPLTVKKAPEGAFFISTFSPLGRLLAIALLWLPATGHTDDCAARRIDRQAAVATVLDGDTVILDSGEHVRFIGLNAPETGHRDRPAQPLAEAARQRLITLLADQENRVLLQFGQERQDHYGRLLAHPFLPDHRNLTAQLLAGGYAFHIVIPPNERHVACYQRAEQAARTTARGVWAHATYHPVSAQALDRGGFQRVRGQVQTVERQRQGIRIQLGRLSVWIPRADWPRFDAEQVTALPGQAIEVRGWVYPRRGQWGLRLRHPQALHILD